MTETNTGPTGVGMGQDNLVGADLRGRDLSKADFVRANLTGANLMGAKLKGANFKFATLQDINLECADLEGAYLRGAELAGANLRGANLQNAILQEAMLQGANLQKADLQRTVFVKADLTEADLSETNLSETNFGGAILHRAILVNTNLQGARLMETNLREAQLVGARLIEAKLQGAHLEGANLLRGILVKANLEGAHLQGTVFSTGNLQEACLAKAEADGAIFTDANLTGVDFKGARLVKADLSGSILFLAYFADANLEEANFIGVKNLLGANFSNSNWYLAQLTTEDRRSLEEKYGLPKKPEPPPPPETEWGIDFDLGAEDAAIEEQGKTVTIFFSDMKESTDYMDRAGLMVGAMKIETHNQMVQPRIQARHGLVVKTMGDGVMAYFNDPLDSILASIDIQKALSMYNHAKPPQERIEVRIGINTGRVLIKNNDLIGPAVNEAARVQAQANPGEILITQTTHGLVKDSRLFRCQFKGEYKLKGVRAKIHIYVVQWRTTTALGSAVSP